MSAAHQHQVVGRFAECEGVSNVPLVRSCVRPREQARGGRQRHLAEFARAQLNPFETEQPHSHPIGRFAEVKLRHVRTFTLTGIGRR